MKRKQPGDNKKPSGAHGWWGKSASPEAAPPEGSSPGRLSKEPTEPALEDSADGIEPGIVQAGELEKAAEELLIPIVRNFCSEHEKHGPHDQKKALTTALTKAIRLVQANCLSDEEM